LELLIVMFLIVVLSTLYYGGGNRGYQMAACEKNLDTIYVALQTWANDYSNTFPTLAGAQTSEPPLSQLIPRYTTGAHFFICPGSKDSALDDAQPFAKDRISYAYYMGHTAKDGSDQPLLSDRQVDTNSKTAGQPLFPLTAKSPATTTANSAATLCFATATSKPVRPPPHST